MEIGGVFMCGKGHEGHELGGPDYHNEPARPYEDNECHHDRRFENRGLLTCQECGMIYNEKICEWENNQEWEY
jgi:hypothetical protein